MQTVKRYDDPLLLALLNLLGFISTMGFLLCVIVLLHGQPNFGHSGVTIYAVWFAISVLSVYVMRQGDIWGAYALGIATIAITLYDIVNGVATLGGAILGILVIMILIMYGKATDRSRIADGLPA